ncbi:MAG: hypothetical protein O7I93_14320 [Gemmatimonadetes bacterium]|nr:hypothetical protein [Gemmatimonadota bacterium]
MIRRVFPHVVALAAALVVVPAAWSQEGASPADTTKKATKELPLEPGRTLAFTATEGTWMSLDVSPDGQTIVFDLLGDLYTMAIGGGEATRLTSGMGYDVQPRFSPDGERVVFVSDRSGAENLWIMSLDGADTTQLTKEKREDFVSPEWTPDGSYVVASKGRNGKLWLYHVDGGSGVGLITEPDNLHTTGAAFGDNDRFI